MKRENKRIEKLCSFYVSNWHLATMLLPYINHKIEENAKIITLLESDIEENIKTLVGKLELKNQKEILEIGWKNRDSQKYAEIENILKEEIHNEKENIILINGCKDYIENNNDNIEKWFQKSNIQELKIINFFEVTEFNHNMIEILNKHDKILNTSGEKEISEVFEGFEKDDRKAAGNE